MEYETIIIFAIVSFFVSLCGIYIGTKLSWREGRKSTETMLDKLLKSEQAAQISNIMNKLNAFLESEEGAETLKNMKNLLNHMTELIDTLLGKGIEITPKKDDKKEELIKLPEKPKNE